MHEAGLMRAAVSALAEATDRQRVGAITLAVNAGVDLASADTAWRLAAVGTCVEGATVHWRRALDRLRCFDCSAEFDGTASRRVPRLRRKRDRDRIHARGDGHRLVLSG